MTTATKTYEVPYVCSNCQFHNFTQFSYGRLAPNHKEAKCHKCGVITRQDKFR